MARFLSRGAQSGAPERWPRFRLDARIPPHWPAFRIALLPGAAAAPARSPRGSSRPSAAAFSLPSSASWRALAAVWRTRNWVLPWISPVLWFHFGGGAGMRTGARGLASSIRNTAVRRAFHDPGPRLLAAASNSPYLNRGLGPRRRLDLKEAP